MKVNILGETPKEQWLNAINIFDMCIKANVSWVRNEVDGDNREKLDTALRVLADYTAEMRRLAEWVTE